MENGKTYRLRSHVDDSLNLSFDRLEDMQAYVLDHMTEAEVAA